MAPESLAEQLARKYLQELDPTLKFLRKSEELMYSQLKADEVILCEDIEATHPSIASILLARDSIWIQRVRDQRPTLEASVWYDLCTGLKDAVFASLAMLYRDEYMKDEYTGSGLRLIKGKIVFVLRPATAEEKQRNIDAKEKIKAVQALWDTAKEVLGRVMVKGRTPGGETLH